MGKPKQVGTTTIAGNTSIATWYYAIMSPDGTITVHHSGNETALHTPDSTPTSDVKLPEGYLPGDGKTFGYLEAYREWELDLECGHLSSYSGTPWSPGVPLKAEFDHGKATDGHGGGIYATKEKKESDYYIYAYENVSIYVIGKVALWGQIKEHKHGYRAEYAYPTQFLDISGVHESLKLPLLRALSDIYLRRK